MSEKISASWATSLDSSVRAAVDAVDPELRYRSPAEIRNDFQELEGQYDNVTMKLCAQRDAFHQSYETFEVAAEEGEGVTIFIFDGVHSNEKVASEASAELFKAIAQNPALLQHLGARRIVYYNADERGVAMNTFSGKSFEEYLFTVFRNATQPDWRFPVKTGDYTYRLDPYQYPGTSAAVDIIDREQPDIMFLGHNAAFERGSSWYASHAIPNLAEALASAGSYYGVPLKADSDGAEMEGPQLLSPDTAVYSTMGIRTLLRYGMNGFGGASTDYVLSGQGNTLVEVCEAPYFVMDQEINTVMNTQEAAKWVNSLLGMGQKALESVRVERLKKDGHAFYNAGRELLPAFNTQEVTPVTSLYVGVALNHVLKAAEQGGSAQSAKTVRQAMNDIVELYEPLSTPVSPQKLVQTHMATIALGAVAAPQARATNRVHHVVDLPIPRYIVT